MENQTPNDQTTSHKEFRGGGGKRKKPPSRRNTPDTLFDQNDQNHCDELDSESEEANVSSFYSQSVAFYVLFGVVLANVVCRKVGVGSGSESREKLKGIADVGNENDIGKQGEKFSCDRVYEIVKLIAEKKFSRDEINRLSEIIRPKATDDFNVEIEKKSSALVAQDVEPPLVSLGCGKKHEQNPEDSSRGIDGISKLQGNKYSSPLLGNIGESAVLLETLRKPSEDEPGYFSRATCETSTPLFQSTNVVCRTVGVGSGSESREKFKGIADVGTENDIGKQGEKFSCDGVYEIEKLIVEKKFSRDEINRLLEILRSKAADDYNVEIEKKSSAWVAVEWRMGGVLSTETVWGSTGESAHLHHDNRPFVDQRAEQVHTQHRQILSSRLPTPDTQLIQEDRRSSFRQVTCGVRPDSSISGMGTAGREVYHGIPRTSRQQQTIAEQVRK